MLSILKILLGVKVKVCRIPCKWFVLLFLGPFCAHVLFVRRVIHDVDLQCLVTMVKSVNLCKQFYICSPFYKFPHKVLPSLDWNCIIITKSFYVIRFFTSFCKFLIKKRKKNLKHLTYMMQCPNSSFV